VQRRAIRQGPLESGLAGPDPWNVLDSSLAGSPLA
jgi:hypothetical protein